MTKLWRPRTLLAFLLLSFPSAGQTSTSSNFSRAPISESLNWIHSAPRNALEYDYEMSVRVRLIFFWAGKDDVGGGYIRRGTAADNPREEMLQVLFGSDPAKAPRAINRWGAGTEAVWHKDPIAGGNGGSVADDVVASTFFGFMKSSAGKSVSEMQDELKKEKSGGAHQFKGIVSQVESGHARSLVVPLASDQDYTLHEYPQAEQAILGKLTAVEKPTRVLDETGGCARAGGFLDAVAQLADSVVRSSGGVSPGDAKAATGSNPTKSLCYIYDSQVNTLTLDHVEPIEKLDVKINTAKGATLAERSYDHLLQADFVSSHQATGKRVYFTILLGTQGDLRGVPVQIRYQPNWWFQVVLNLMTKTHAHS
jgi:hypothetical protein